MFDDASITVVSDDGEKERGDNRIKLGILHHLKKLIQIIERFGSDVDEKGDSQFKIVFDYQPIMNKDKGVDYVATEVSFESSILKMKMDGFRTAEFVYLSDDEFLHKIFSANDPIYVDVSADAIDTIIKTSEIVKTDARKDGLVFYVDGEKLYVRNRMSDKNKPSDFEYMVGNIDKTPTYPIRFPVNREKFIKMITKAEGNLRIILGHSGKVGLDGNYTVNRILFDSLNTSTKIVIAGMSEN